MGCWNETCMISHLPITAGDKVIWLLLTDTSYPSESGKTGCYHSDFWAPRCIPIRAEYNDYGSIENWETGPILDSMLAQFKRDLIPQPLTDREKTIGVKPLDPETMTMDELLSYLREGNVIIDRDMKLRTHHVLIKQATGKDVPPAPPRGVHVAQIMILASVWDRLCQMKREIDWHYKGYGLNTISDYKFEEDEILSCLKQWEGEKDPIFAKMARLGLDHMVPFQERYGTNPYDQLLDLAEAKIPREQLEPLARRVQELRIINEHLAGSRHHWGLTTGSGSQNVNRIEHAILNFTYAEVALQEEINEFIEHERYLDRDAELEEWKDFAQSFRKMKQRITKLLIESNKRIGDKIAQAKAAEMMGKKPG